MNMNDCPVRLCKLPKFRHRSDTTDILNVHYRFNTTQPSEYIAIFQKLAPSTIQITVLATTHALRYPSPSLTFRIHGGPRYTLPDTVTYPHVLNYPDTFLVLPTITSTTNYIIPRIIIQIWPESIVSHTMGVASDAWMKLNPEYTYVSYDKVTALEFIKLHFNKHVVRAYELLERDDCRTYLFRYCYLYIYGGIFVDTVTVPQVPLYAYIARDTIFALVDSQLSCGVGTSFIATQKENPLIEYLIRNIVWNICTKQQTHISESIVKDAIFGRSLNIYFGRESNSPDPLRELNTGYRRLYTTDNTSILDKMKRIILYNTYINPEVNTLVYTPIIPSSSADDESVEDPLVIGKLPLLSHPSIVSSSPHPSSSSVHPL